MSYAPLSERNVRKFATKTGVPFDRVCGCGDVNLFEGRTNDDRHFVVDRRTWQAEEIEAPTHWSSCRELRSA
jgi:hypothetical protein